MKRAIDFIVSFLALLILSPLILIISLIIFFGDNGPILFLQSRVGKNGKEFNIFKFRTMIVNANELGPNRTLANDNRITPIGKILRKYSLDELPQFINVIIGDMSFIGYRPGLKINYSDEHLASDVFKYRPGITGLAQVNGRSGLTSNEKRKLEVAYSHDVTLIKDLLILIKTVKVVITGRGSL
jgi:lipopolysaccharide/colanic/teichoic acid biosynthesis glycosyltransferase